MNLVNGIPKISVLNFGICFNARKHFGEHFRVFPISNWTELDVWQYLAMENVELPSLYFAHKRRVFERDGILLADSEHIAKRPEEEAKVKELMVRCRTIGDTTCTGVWESEATTIEQIIEEVAVARKTERGGRADDKRSETAMEDRKKQGYF
jgi:sulfate adenylyltransferase subunit 2